MHRVRTIRGALTGTAADLVEVVLVGDEDERRAREREEVLETLDHAIEHLWAVQLVQLIEDDD